MRGVDLGVPMATRIFSLASLVGTAVFAMAVAEPPLLTPADGSPIGVARGPGNVEFGDFNKDGRPDLVVASAGPRLITILLGQGNGRFSPLSDRPLPVPESPTELATEDIDSDTNVDLLLGSHDSHNVTILRGDGRGAFTLASSSPVVMKPRGKPHTHGLAMADFNRDGRVDIATVNSDDENDVAVVLADGKGRFAAASGSPFAVGPSPYPLALGDVNSDRNVDMVVSSTGQGSSGTPSHGLTALFGDGRGGFTGSEIPSRTKRTWFVDIGDLNGDRRPDVIATHAENRLLTVLLGDGRGTFTEVPQSPFDLGSNAWAVRLADLNRDGKADAVAAAATGVSVLLGDGRGAFVRVPGSPFATGKGTWKLAVADVNSDGKLDVATSNLESNTVTVLLGR